MTFACGDIHGNIKALKQCLEKSKFDYEEDTLISLGDVVDGYPDSYLCVEELMKIKNLIPIRGNHDQAFLEFLLTGQHGYNWKEGAINTALSYAKDIDTTNESWLDSFTTKDVPREHKLFFAMQLPYYVLDNKMFTHGGFNRHLKISAQSEEIFMIDRDLWYSAVTMDEININRTKSFTKNNFDAIFIGHTKTTHWKKAVKYYENGEIKEKIIPMDLPMKKSGVFNLDTGAGFPEGKLTIMDVNNYRFWQSEPSKKLYPNFIPRQNKL